MGFKAGDVVQLKEKFAGRRYKGKVLKIRSDFGEKLLVVSQPNNMIANFPEEQWELVTTEGENQDEDNTE